MRCFGSGSKIYEQYHDHEWGVPVHEDNRLFEMLILEGAQAGLSFETILKRREFYREAFYGFDPKKVANMSDEELETLLSNPKLIRNRLKIFSSRQNARVFLKIQEEFGSFDAYLRRFVNGYPIRNSWKTLEEVPTSTEESRALSKDLKNRGMTFVGPTIMYAYMQAIGMVYDHVTCCLCHLELSAQLKHSC